ncbi:hypothetical protein ABFS82_09G116800 [Erythranthe guttata]
MKTIKNENSPELWLVVITLFSIMLGCRIGLSVRRVFEEVGKITVHFDSENLDSSMQSSNMSKIYIAPNPCKTEGLTTRVLAGHPDFSLRVNVGNETVRKPSYLLILTVGIRQKDIVAKIVSKFSDDFAIILFHYDGKTSEWDQFEWSQRAIHVSALTQAKWWYAKRFLHPDLVAQYEYIFMWDEDLGVEHFNAQEYIRLVKKYDLEISQPAVKSNTNLSWKMTQRRKNVEIHRFSEEPPEYCPNPFSPPCAGFVEIMAPVFSRKSWNCVWHMIQNDLVHGWGLDFAFWKCVEKPEEKIGVVDAQWIKHLVLPTLSDESKSINRTQARLEVRARSHAEWKEFEKRMKEAEKQHSVKL